jgi:hypothetical protein
MLGFIMPPLFWALSLRTALAMKGHTLVAALKSIRFPENAPLFQWVTSKATATGPDPLPYNLMPIPAAVRRGVGIPPNFSGILPSFCAAFRS